MSVDCDEVRMALGAYALGALDPREAAEVYEHLGWCPFCRVEADEFLGLPALLGRVTEADIEQASRPPRAVLERMLKVRARRRRITQAVLAAAASLGGGAVGGSIWVYAVRPGGGEESAGRALARGTGMAASPAADAHAAEPTRTVTAARSRHTSRELTASRGEVRAVLRLR